MRGFFGIGCIDMKYNTNYGTLFRSAQVMGADFIFLIGKRFKKQSSDTMHSYKHIPLYEYDSFEDFYKNMPLNSKLIGVETSGSEDLVGFKHPEQACYLLGSEDRGIPSKYLKRCDRVVSIPSERSLNVSVTGSIILYDRIAKIKNK